MTNVSSCIGIALMQYRIFNVYSLLQLVKEVFLRKTLGLWKIGIGTGLSLRSFSTQNIPWFYDLGIFYSVVWKYLKPIAIILTIFEEVYYRLLNWNKLQVIFSIQYNPEGQMAEEKLNLTIFLYWFKTIVSKGGR